MKNSWKIENDSEFHKSELQAGAIIQLITPNEFEDLPKGTILYSIFGERKVKGKDYIDGDTRFGYMAFGIHRSK